MSTVIQRRFKWNVEKCKEQRDLAKQRNKDTVLKFYKGMSVPSLPYRSKSWNMKERDKRLLASEMTFLSSVACYKRIDHERNVEITEELNVFKLSAKVVVYGNLWISHIQRMEPQKYQDTFWIINPLVKGILDDAQRNDKCKR
jgi:hypothetical protein